MALKKPLVVINGQVAQISSSDILDAQIQEVESVSLENEQGSTIVIGNIVYPSSTGKVKLAKANDQSTKNYIGLVTDTSVADAAQAAIQTEGVVEATTTQWDAVAGTTGGLTSGSVYYLSASDAGEITEAAPEGSFEYVSQAGIAISSTELQLLHQQDVRLASLGEVSLLRTTGASTFDPTIIRDGGISPTWYMGDGNSYTADSVSHDYASAGDYEVSWLLSPTTKSTLTDIWVQNDNLTEFTSDAGWTSLTSIRLNDNAGLTSFVTHSTWPIEDFRLYETGITSITLQPNWTGITNCDLHNTNISDLAIPGGWTSLEKLYLSRCYNLTTITVPNDLNSIVTFSVFDCDLGATPIDNVLIALDSGGSTNGSSKYQDNPGSADGSRSGAAATAKSNLVSKGWVITN